MKSGGSYDPDKYGQGFVKIREGVHQFTIEKMSEKKGKRGQYIEAKLKCTDPEYSECDMLKAWLFGEESIYAIFDAMGVDPQEVDDDKDYDVRSFVGESVYAEIHHVPSKKKPENTFANIKKLHPAFSKGIEEDGPPEEEGSDTEEDDPNIPF